jgi:hypothetical protein
MRTLAIAWTSILLLVIAACETRSRQDAFEQLQDFVPDSEPYKLEVVVDGQPLMEVEHAGRRYVEGREGSEYVIRFRNRTRRRLGLLISVDGLNIMNRQPVRFQVLKDYFIVEGGEHTFRGFRTDSLHVEAFTFTRAGESLASRLGSSGSAGLIAVAVYPEVENPEPEPMYAHKNLIDFGSARGSQNLGTGTGRMIQSRLGSARAIQAENAHQPAAILEIYYNDRKGLCDSSVMEFCSP